MGILVGLMRGSPMCLGQGLCRVGAWKGHLWIYTGVSVGLPRSPEVRSRSMDGRLLCSSQCRGEYTKRLLIPKATTYDRVGVLRDVKPN